MSEQTTPLSSVSGTRLLIAGVLTVIAAVIANLVARALFFALFQVPDFVPFQPGRIAFLTAGGVGAAALAFAVIVRRSDRPARTFQRVAVVALILSIVPNVALAANPEAAPFPVVDGASTGFLILIIFHVVAAVISVILLPRLARG